MIIYCAFYVVISLCSVDHRLFCTYRYTMYITIPKINLLRETNIWCDEIRRIKVDYYTNKCN